MRKPKAWASNWWLNEAWRQYLQGPRRTRYIRVYQFKGLREQARYLHRHAAGQQRACHVSGCAMNKHLSDYLDTVWKPNADDLHGLA